MASNQSNWTISGSDGKEGHQVDLIINRADRIVNMCEMKFYNDDFEVTADYAKTIRNRMNTLIGHLSKRSSVQPTLVTSFGLKPGKNSGVFTKTVVLDDLFLL